MKEIVGEDNVGTNNNVIANGHAVPDHAAVPNCDAISEGHSAFDIGVIADLAVTLDDRSLHHMTIRPNTRSGPNLVGIEHSRG